MPCRTASSGIMISRGPDVDTHVGQHTHTLDERKIDEDVFSWSGKRRTNVEHDWKTRREVERRKRVQRADRVKCIYVARKELKRKRERERKQDEREGKGYEEWGTGDDGEKEETDSPILSVCPGCPCTVGGMLHVELTGRIYILPARIFISVRGRVTSSMTGGRDACCLVWLCLTAFLRSSLRRATVADAKGTG